MSLNWKEIGLILKELDLCGAQIQSAAQSAYDVIALRVHKRGATRQILIALTSGACRIHETFKPFPKNDKPLRFAQFLNSRIVNGWIEDAAQLGDNRIVRLTVRRRGKPQDEGPEHSAVSGEGAAADGSRYYLYIRLWSNAANVIVTNEAGAILDAMRRLPKRGEITGGRYTPEAAGSSAARREYEIRELPGEGSFNAKIDAWYAQRGGALSLEALREQARRNCEGSMGRLAAALERLRAREAEFSDAQRLREYGGIILANVSAIKTGDEWLETDNFISGGTARIQLEPRASPAQQAERYYEQYRKAKTGLAGIRMEIARGEREMAELTANLERLLAETNPLALAKLLKSGGGAAGPAREQDKKRPGLSFRRGEWLLMVGRDAAENDALLRRHVKGSDLWLHARDFPGAYVFIKHRAGKTFPLDILLDAGNLAVFYSKGRNNGEGDLFYTPVKYLRRAKNGPKGLVIPTQEKNLHIKIDETRLRELETCRVEK